MDRNDKESLPIIGGGEKLIEAIEKKTGFGEVTYPQTYSQAKTKIQEQVVAIKETINEIPEERRMKEVVITLRLNEKFLAKSYVPNTLFRKANLENIGSKRWLNKKEEKEEVAYSKMHFLKLNEDSISNIEKILSADSDVLTDTLKNDIRKVEEISLLSTDEIVQGFTEDWKEGTVEFILHPFGDENEEMINKFKDILIKNNVDKKTIKVKNYQNGPTFISGYLNEKVLKEVSNFNPLRAVHPLRSNFFPMARNLDAKNLALRAPIRESVSQIKVGVFDGGIDSTHPLLVNYANENKSLNNVFDKDGIEHGTAVAGVVLYGDLNQYTTGLQVPEPTVSVESFKVFPLSDPMDYDLYEIIDFIEEVVPTRHDIDVYNLSFGPIGPILDDDITRFTYALDELAWEYKKLFIVAVGNEGDLVEPLNRIQAPGDLVNGLGVGAFTFDYNTSEKVRAPYSSVGDGREGCKVKPDIVAFGGDQHFPIHLLSTNHTNRWLDSGTSFASPLVAGKAAEILGRCRQFNPIVARALLIHSANHPDQVCNELGYGIVDKNVDEILNCDQNKVTVIYSSSINPKSYAKLPIPLPVNADISSDVHLEWTISTLTKTNPLHLEDYTESAIEDTFYPHSRKYKFTKDSKTKTVNVDDEKVVAELLDDGWIQGSLPASSSAEQFQSEQARRGEMKWDTVMKKWKRMRIMSLDKPSLVIHGLGRNGNSERIDYAVAMTITVPRYQGNLHEDILNEFGILEPVFIQNKSDIMIPIR